MLYMTLYKYILNSVSIPNTFLERIGKIKDDYLLYKVFQKEFKPFTSCGV